MLHDNGLVDPSAGNVLVFYPGSGIFPLLDKSICLRNDAFPRVPAPGDRVLLFVTPPSVDPGSKTIAAFDQNIIIQRAGADVAELPMKLQRSEALNGARDLDAVGREVIRKKQEEGR
jgi:hypothetical protein